MSENAASVDDTPSTIGDRLLRLLWRRGATHKPKSANRWSTMRRLIVGESLLNLSLIALASSLCGTGVLYLLNSEANLVKTQEYSLIPAVGFVLFLLIYRFSQRQLIRRSCAAIEAALHDWRERITGKVLRLSLRDMEELSPGRVADGLSRHYTPLSQSIVTIVAGVEAGILLVFMYAYLLVLSPIAAGLTTIVAILCVIAYLNVAKDLARTMNEATSVNAQLDRLSESSIKGAKELRLNAVRRDALLEDIVDRSGKLSRNRSRSAAIFAEVISSGNTASFLMAGAVVFIMPLIGSVDGEDIPMIAMAVIFLIGPIGGVVGSLQQLSVARFAVGGILDFEERVDQMLAGNGQSHTGEDYSQFRQINLRGVGYSHPRSAELETPFGIRGINLAIRRGQLTFISGGNGSGKTTLLRVLTGLYPRAEGNLEVDSLDIPRKPGQDYRDLFAVVLSDFHIFDRVYALDEQGLTILERWLTELNIRHKLPADLAQGLNPEALSTGQRKRLALALALAEQRPILVLDEWAADQDPATRRRFYDEILPRLKTEGKTIIAVTHDETYFDRADQHVGMQEGLLVDRGRGSGGSFT